MNIRGVSGHEVGVRLTKLQANTHRRLLNKQPGQIRIRLGSIRLVFKSPFFFFLDANDRSDIADVVFVT